MRNYFLLLTTVFLAGCSDDMGTRTLRPGKNGTDRPYTITNSFMTNKRFEPQSHLEYEAVGLASWYGPGFHGKKTSIGETYNQYDFTAAHPTLPLPAIVKVTNLENGKSTVLRVTDRGPFVNDERIIDISLAGAKELGFYHKGKAKVKVETLILESLAYNEKKIFVGEAAHLANFVPPNTVRSTKAPPSRNIRIASVSKTTPNITSKKPKRVKI